eukprot:365338-Chlamydomonas_euryale.AAC.8
MKRVRSSQVDEGEERWAFRSHWSHWSRWSIWNGGSRKGHIGMNGRKREGHIGMKGKEDGHIRMNGRGRRAHWDEGEGKTLGRQQTAIQSPASLAWQLQYLPRGRVRAIEPTLAG